MFLNLSNHPSATWSAVQRDAALTLASPIEDLPFPAVPPEHDRDEVVALAERLVEHVLEGVTHALVAGEYVLCMSLVALLQARGIICVAACSDRDSVADGTGGKRVVFRFVRMREFPLITLGSRSRGRLP